MDNQDLNSFKRVDESHPLDLYIGIDDLSRSTLFLVSQSEPPMISASQIINVAIGKRKDDKWGISFTLQDNKFKDLFTSFCNDIIDSSRSLKNKDLGAAFICDRYEKWQDMLSKLNGELLSPPLIKGLIGELIFLKEYLFPLYGQEKSLNSWIGPERADQDFVCEDTWYEVKATVSGSESVIISSIEQLESPITGELAIVYLDKTSYSDNSKLTLNSLFKEIHDSLANEILKNKFGEILLNLGYCPIPEYDGPAFKFSGIERFKVDSKFPFVKRDILPEAVLNLNYKLSIPLLKKSVSKI